MKLNPFSALRARSERRSESAVDALAQALYYGGNVSASGVRVTPETALASVAVAACIEVRAETFSALPGGVFQKDGRMRVPVTDHPVARLLFDRPNDLMTSGEALRWKQIREDVTGNAHFRIIYKGGRANELWPLYGPKPELRIAKGKIAYYYEGDAINPRNTYPSEEILHFRGPFLKEPFEARSPIDLIRDTVGLSISTEQFFGRFLNNGSHFPAYLETDSVLKKEDVDALKEQLGATAGLFAAGTLRIFDRGLKVKQNSMSLKDADLTGQMRWYLEQICRIYRVPLPLVQDWTHGTYTNSEQAGLWFAQHAITPICVDTERAVRKLFIPGEEELYVKFNMDAILRGDYTSRTSGYSVLINCGVLSPNEARAFEDMDPYEGGDEHRLPLNTAPAGAALAAEPPLPAKNTVKAEEVPSAPDPGLTAGDAAQPRDVLEPFYQNRLEVIRTRAAQDRARGRDTAVTIKWAKRQVKPLEEAYRRAGLELIAEDVIAEALNDEEAGAENA